MKTRLVQRVAAHIYAMNVEHPVHRHRRIVGHENARRLFFCCRVEEDDLLERCVDAHMQWAVVRTKRQWHIDEIDCTRIDAYFAETMKCAHRRHAHNAIINAIVPNATACNRE